MERKKTDRYQICLADNIVLNIYALDGVIYAQVDGGSKHEIATRRQKLKIDHQNCEKGQARIEWENGAETFLEISGKAITVL